ncbi:inner membrane CreD family protein [Desulfosarcina cetonica]|uniref:inner membrane CreD family protein n=1 Tax=Desulfosarcina cetonica TaxID=90730 RepID=UPI0009F86B04|nr:inner membrane CreD family protein [Desulfosarcina cetonica]
MAVMVGGILTVLYGYLYILLQLTDYALLMGSLGLFVLLALVMFLTRRVDWYAMRATDSVLDAASTSEGVAS